MAKICDTYNYLHNMIILQFIHFVCNYFFYVVSLEIQVTKRRKQKSLMLKPCHISVIYYIL